MQARRFVLFFVANTLALAGVVKVEVDERSPLLDTGYERIVGKVRFAVDPKLAANRIISDIDLAPRNHDGKVEFSADLFVLQPKDAQKSNGTILFEVSNRGGKGLLSTFNRARGSIDPRTEEQLGDRFLLNRGFTLVWLGWQPDVPRNPGLLRLHAPIAKNPDGSPITGIVRAEFTPERVTTRFPLADRNHIPYLVIDPADSSLQLTVREHRDSERKTIPRAGWKFTDSSTVEMESGFQPYRIYELVYRSQDPVLVGLGPAAIRDLISYAKSGAGPIVGQRAIGFGTSQSGRFLRAFLYWGFNADEQGHRVFDGVWPNVAGAGRGSFNHRFAQPSRDGHPNLNTFYPTDIAPFDDDGLLARARQDHVEPKIFYTNGSYEYWGRNASLIHTTPDGTKDYPPARDSRIYFMAGTQHGPGSVLTREGSQNMANPTDYRWVLRALLDDFQAWIAHGTAPPASSYPRIDKGELVPLEAVRFPGPLPKYPFAAYPVYYGAEFESKGIVTVDPPRVGTPFGTRFPQVDQDGNEIAGVKVPEVAVPLATYTGWNLVDAVGVVDEMYSMRGSYLPWPRSKIDERYASREAYLERVQGAAKALVNRRLLLESDLGPVIDHAAREWDRVHK